MGEMQQMLFAGESGCWMFVGLLNGKFDMEKMLWQFPFKKICGSQKNLFSLCHRFAIAQELSRKRKMMAYANKLFGKGLCSEVSLGLLKYKFERVRHFEIIIFFSKKISNKFGCKNLALTFAIQYNLLVYEKVFKASAHTHSELNIHAV